MLGYILFYYILFLYIILHIVLYFILYFILYIIYYILLNYIILYYTILQYIIFYYTILNYAIHNMYIWHVSGMHHTFAKHQFPRTPSCTKTPCTPNSRRFVAGGRDQALPIARKVHLALEGTLGDFFPPAWRFSPLIINST